MVPIDGIAGVSGGAITALDGSERSDWQEELCWQCLLDMPVAGVFGGAMVPVKGMAGVAGGCIVAERSLAVTASFGGGIEAVPDIATSTSSGVVILSLCF